MGDFNLSGGVGIMGFVSPMDTRDNYAVTDPIYGVDGLRNVSVIEDLHKISAERRRAGMIVGVNGGETYYKLKNLSFWSFEISDWEESTLFNNKPSLNTEIRFSDHEIPLGLVDGQNKVFKLTNTPTDTTLHLYLNGLLQFNNNVGDYLLSGDTITFNQTPPIGSRISCTYRYELVIDNLNQARFSDLETPIGNVNGINTFFMLENEPKNNSEHIYLNGLLMDNGGDYLIVGREIIFQYPPPNNSRIKCSYRY